LFSHLSGADLASLVREAAVSALRTTLYSQSNNLSVTEKLPDDEIFVNASHFEMAFNKVSSSVSISDKKRYDSLRIKLGCATENKVAGKLNK
jgi:ribosome biogenesis ATPase